MTVSYTLKVAEARFGGFSGLLLRWRGSIYKLLYKEFLLFIALYALLSITYRLLLTQAQKHVYAQVARYCNRSADLIPLSFVLGKAAWIFRCGRTGRSCSLSPRRRSRLYPSHLNPSGFMSQEERKKFESLKSDFNKYWVPCVWFTNLAAQARRDGRVRDDIALCLLLEELNKYRAKCSMLFHYDWISIPLVYTQVVTIAVYSFFALSLVGRQFVEPEAGAAEPREPLESGQEPAPALGDLDMYVPLTTLLQFFFYAGWLKVAEQIINPFGEDDDDFETNKLIDRNLQVSLLSVDDMYQNLPPAEQDPYWDEDLAQPPYTVATAAETLRPSFLGSTFNLR
ncbi:bestrophin-4 [Echinops telfairi]|uniref:Bestrophin n=1 Tax=Echinops telfairi TaxID=9371 RepID=A0ABM0IGS2_ECHTE|nr:bestrophin-4 [Echinops telfairi]